jgi:ParB-like chromosome segregation protein Spo0J
MSTPVNGPIEIHPAALLFPVMGDTEVGKLAEDIGKNGLLEPIVLYEGMVLDGRSRLAACKIAGVDHGGQD